MSHFFTVVMVPETAPQKEIDATCERLLVPYDENICVAPYKRYRRVENILQETVKKNSFSS